MGVGSWGRCVRIGLFPPQLQMLGYDISWAAFNIIEVMSASKFTFKVKGTSSLWGLSPVGGVLGEEGIRPVTQAMLRRHTVTDTSDPFPSPLLSS